MAFIGPWGQFIHIPKCAGMAMREYLSRTNRQDGYEENGMHALPNEISNAFTIIRHPADWLVSFYTYYAQNNWLWEDLPEYVDSQFSVAIGRFWPQFIDLLTSKNPGAVSNVFNYYCQPGVKVYKLEELDTHFVGIQKKHSTTDKPPMTPAQRHLICTAEFATMNKYNYA